MLETNNLQTTAIYISKIAIILSNKIPSNSKKSSQPIEKYYYHGDAPNVVFPRKSSALILPLSISMGRARAQNLISSRGEKERERECAASTKNKETRCLLPKGHERTSFSFNLARARARQTICTDLGARINGAARATLEDPCPASSPRPSRGRYLAETVVSATFFFLPTLWASGSSG